MEPTTNPPISKQTAKALKIQVETIQAFANAVGQITGQDVKVEPDRNPHPAMLEALGEDSEAKGIWRMTVGTADSAATLDIGYEAKRREMWTMPMRVCVHVLRVADGNRYETLPVWARFSDSGDQPDLCEFTHEAALIWPILDQRPDVVHVRYCES